MSHWHVLEDCSFRQRFSAIFLSPASQSHLLFDDSSTVVPQSFHEYTDLLLLPECFPDILFVYASALFLNIQIIIISDSGSPVIIAPSSATYRIFVTWSSTHNHYNHAHSLHVTCNDPTACSQSRRFHFRQSVAPLLDPEIVPPFRPQFPMESAPDLSHRRIAQIHSVHCGFTGHPGVEATVRALMDLGHTWKGMTAQVTHFIKRCPTCNSSRLPLKHAPVSAATLRLFSRPLKLTKQVLSVIVHSLVSLASSPLYVRQPVTLSFSALALVLL
jgi:hypothetical protein